MLSLVRMTSSSPLLMAPERPFPQGAFLHQKVEAAASSISFQLLAPKVFPRLLRKAAKSLSSHRP